VAARPMIADCPAGTISTNRSSESGQQKQPAAIEEPEHTWAEKGKAAIDNAGEISSQKRPERQRPAMTPLLQKWFG